jgi:asparagine synthase (glutamine-hydrolysing)
MCGLVATWSPRLGVLAGDLDAIEVLRHRGPDAVSRWVAPTGAVGLAQARLSVVGIRNGAQPVSDESGQVMAVVNGEFYGYARQRRDLAGRGHTLVTDADSEIAVHLYEEDPAGFVEHLRGEFAVVLWDQARGRLLAIRDRFGVKPLYYAWIAGRLVLASEIKALFAAGAGRRWDAESFYDYLHACFAPERTLFDGIFQVPPGAMLAADQGGVRVTRYWDLDYPLATAPEADLIRGPAAVQAIRAQAAEAVRLRLVADVPVGFQLSGGLDSSSVTGLAAGQVELRTFTVSFPGSALDEGDVAGRTARALGAEHHEVTVGSATYGSAAAEAITAGEMLQENGHGTARLALSGAIARAGLRVALAGEGGDELFAGYGHLQADAARSVSADQMALAQRSFGRLAAGQGPATLTGALRRLGFIPAWLIDRCMTTSLPARRLLHRDLAAAFADRDCVGELIERADGQLRGRSPLHMSMYLFIRTWFCNYILAAERLDMARSVEVRLPLLDHRLFETVRRLPPDALAGPQAKQVFRDAMRGYLTEEVFRGVKRPFFAPPAADGRAAAAVLGRSIADGALDGSALFDRAAVASFLRQVETAAGPVTDVQDRLLHLISSVSILHDAYGLRS